MDFKKDLFQESRRKPRGYSMKFIRDVTTLDDCKVTWNNRERQSKAQLRMIRLENMHPLDLFEDSCREELHRAGQSLRFIEWELFPTMKKTITQFLKLSRLNSRGSRVNQDGVFVYGNIDRDRSCRMPWIILAINNRKAMQVFQKDELLAGRYRYDSYVENVKTILRIQIPIEIRILCSMIQDYLFYCREIRIDEYTEETSTTTLESPPEY
jgi:hypothetical protein